MYDQFGSAYEQMGGGGGPGAGAGGPFPFDIEQVFGQRGGGAGGGGGFNSMRAILEISSASLPVAEDDRVAQLRAKAPTLPLKSPYHFTQLSWVATAKSMYREVRNEKPCR